MQTATSRLLCALVLLHATGRTALARNVRVDVVYDGPLASRALEAMALKEATVIWAAYGVDINASRGGDCESTSAVRLTVRFGNGPDRGMAAASLGSIRFLDGVPEPAIVLYPHVIASLVSGTPPGSFIVNSQGVVRDLVLGRVLGRALAHEIGHFLLRSQQHSAVGLMRALQPTADLVDPHRDRFGLSADDVSRLAAMTSSFPQPFGSLSCGD
jgi:hypothetical protein